VEALWGWLVARPQRGDGDAAMKQLEKFLDARALRLVVEREEDVERQNTIARRLRLALPLEKRMNVLVLRPRKRSTATT
jgi:hypothetical protein